MRRITTQHVNVVVKNDTFMVDNRALSLFGGTPNPIKKIEEMFQKQLSSTKKHHLIYTVEIAKVTSVSIVKQ